LSSPEIFHLSLHICGGLTRATRSCLKPNGQVSCQGNRRVQYNIFCTSQLPKQIYKTMVSYPIKLFPRQSSSFPIKEQRFAGVLWRLVHFIELRPVVSSAHDCYSIILLHFAPPRSQKSLNTSSDVQKNSGRVGYVGTIRSMAYRGEAEVKLV
jgi:hypothetical protein